jgi:hypothetical protein
MGGPRPAIIATIIRFEQTTLLLYVSCPDVSAQSVSVMVELAHLYRYLEVISP